MSPYRRNVTVGAVVLTALLALAWMLIQFGGRFVSPFAPETIRAQFVADRADGISNGSNIIYRGVVVGRVEKVTRANDQLRVYIHGSLDSQPPLPGNVRGTIRSQGIVGAAASIVLETTEPQPSGQLQPDQEIPTTFVGLDLLPPEFSQLATELRDAVKQFRESNVVVHLDTQVSKVGRLVDSVDNLVNDEKLRENIRVSLASIRTTMEKVDRIAGQLEQFTGKLDKLADNTSQAVTDARGAIGKTEAEILAISKQTMARLEQVSKLLADFQAISAKVNSGQGTAGALVNDPKLYQNLVETTQELNATARDLRRLVEQWEQEGVSLKLK